MNKKFFMTALCFMAVVSQDAWAMNFAPIVATVLQATAAVDNNAKSHYDIAFIFAPVVADEMSSVFHPGGVTSLNAGVSAVCCLRALYLHKDFFKKKFTNKRICKLAGTAIGSVFCFKLAGNGLFKLTMPLFEDFNRLGNLFEKLEKFIKDTAGYWTDIDRRTGNGQRVFGDLDSFGRRIASLEEKVQQRLLAQAPDGA